MRRLVNPTCAPAALAARYALRVHVGCDAIGGVEVEAFIACGERPHLAAGAEYGEDLLGDRRRSRGKRRAWRCYFAPGRQAEGMARAAPTLALPRKRGREDDSMRRREPSHACARCRWREGKRGRRSCAGWSGWDSSEGGLSSYVRRVRVGLLVGPVRGSKTSDRTDVQSSTSAAWSLS